MKLGGFVVVIVVVIVVVFLGHKTDKISSNPAANPISDGRTIKQLLLVAPLRRTGLSVFSYVSRGLVFAAVVVVVVF